MTNMKSHVNRNCVKRVFLTVFLLSSLVGLSSVNSAQTGEPPREPILRIETGMHTGVIRRIGVDGANRFLVTASDDKTLRVWELPSGRLLRIIRVPINETGDSSEGMLSAVAVSPDGHTIAAGGYTVGGDRGENIYLFDSGSGKLTRRLSGITNAVNHLAYSPDGRYLVAVLKSTSPSPGMRVWRTRDLVEVGRDTAYNDDSYGADFDTQANW